MSFWTCSVSQSPPLDSANIPQGKSCPKYQDHLLGLYSPLDPGPVTLHFPANPLITFKQVFKNILFRFPSVLSKEESGLELHSLPFLEVESLWYVSLNLSLLLPSSSLLLPFHIPSFSLPRGPQVLRGLSHPSPYPLFPSYDQSSMLLQALSSSSCLFLS